MAALKRAAKAKVTAAVAAWQCKPKWLCRLWRNRQKMQRQRRWREKLAKHAASKSMAAGVTKSAGEN
jgi:hypothetical protein